MATEGEQLMNVMRQMAEQVNRLAMIQQGQMNQNQQQMPQPEPPRQQERAGKPWDDVNYFRNVKVFDGDNKEWEEFQTKLKSQIAAGSPRAAEILDYTETETTEMELADAKTYNYEIDDAITEDMTKETSYKLHNLLISLTTGEANTHVRRCKDRNGLLAWKRLSTKLNPRTLASGVKAISAVLNPAKISQVTKADSALEYWEDRVAKLAKEYNETISSKVSVAVLYGMLPKDLQERILDKCSVDWGALSEQQSDDILVKIKADIKNMAKSRREMITPKPMECDNVVEKSPEEEQQEQWQAEDEEWVNSVGKGNFKGKGKGGKTTCWICGEQGIPPS